ncbi:hypothetical protein GCM10009716_25160 [Streptomyces sodiiphilus]|uniref:Integral membrane protein n=1 Tax=Streptomyces sodiiphilus TaxID=226217 RepID=A0ABN2PB08_9ACTN
MSPRTTAKRGRFRRAGESAVGMLLLARLAAMALLALLLVAAGAWASWDTARHALRGDGLEQGTLTLRSCDADACTGTFRPSEDAGRGDAPVRQNVTLEQSIGRGEGDTLHVALRPGTDEAVRTGVAGALQASLPLAGALLLAAVVVAGGLRMFRTAWSLAGLGLAMIGTTFLLW